MAITGTGTQADPYVVTIWAELASKAAESGKYVKLGNDIDINTEYPEGLETGFQIRCAEVDGDGKTIKNLFVKSSYLINNGGMGSIWKNTNFLNMALGNGDTATKFYHDGGYFIGHELTFNLCKFSGRINGGTGNAKSYFTSGELTLNRCSLNIELSANSAIAVPSSSISTCKMQYCNVHLTGATSEEQIMVLDNSYVKGTLSNASIDTTSYSGTKSVYSVLDITIPSATGNSGTNLVLCNSEKCSTISEYLTTVTSAQLTNAEYLDGIGFPIQT